MELYTCARPYSLAAFSYANKVSKVDQWLEMLELCSKIYLHEKIQSILSSYQYSKQEKLSIFVDMCKDSLSVEFINFIKLIFINGRIKLLPIIKKQFFDHKMKLENISYVKVYSAYSLKKKQQQEIKTKISTRLNRDVILENIIDKNILSGFLLEFGDTIIDASLKSKIVSLKNQIIG